MFAHLFHTLLSFSWINEVEITLNVVRIRSRLVEVFFGLGSYSSSDCDTLLNMIYIFDVWILSRAYISFNNWLVVSIHGLFRDRLSPLDFETRAVCEHQVNISSESIDVCSRAWYFSSFS